MKRLPRLLFLLTLLVAVLFAAPQPVWAGVQDFRIESFTADYYLSRDKAKESSMKVRESIIAVFPEFDQNHGILRAIPMRYHDHSLSLAVSSVTNGSGTALPYTTYESADNLVLKIGGAGKYVHGRQQYVIEYSMKNVISYFKDHDELYWDINGDQWQQPFGTVTARIHLPSDIMPSYQDRTVCYAGYYGSAGTDCTVSLAVADGLDSSEYLITSTAQNLQAGETLSVVLGFEKGTFQQGASVLREQRRQLISLIIGLAGLILLPIAIIVYFFRRWWKYGRDPKGRGVIVPQYQRPKDLSLMSAGMVMEEHVRPKAISASLIDLAVRRYLNIYETEVRKGLFGKRKQYDLELVKAIDDLSKEEQSLLQAIFGSSASAGKRKDLDVLRSKLHDQLKEIDKEVGNGLAGRLIFRRAPHHVRNTWAIRSFIILGAGIIISLGSSWLKAEIAALWAAGLSVGGFISLIFAASMPARTKTGVELRDYLLGMKDYIKLAEAERLKYLQSPSGAEKIQIDDKFKVKLFEDLLPFAMLFGLEKDWAEQFKDLYTQPPEWFHGSWTTFNAVYLASAIGSLNTASTAAFSASRSSGSSGFGGGGFSGGGGGGGGGGGW